MTRRAVLVVARDYDLQYRPYDGFSRRHIDIVRGIADRFDVSLLVFGDAEVSAELAPMVRDRLAVPRPDNSSRARRLRSDVRIALGRLDLEGAGLEHRIAAQSPDLVLTVGPWLRDEFRGAFGRVPSVHLFEEDLLSMRELAPQSAQARLFRRLEASLQGRSRRQPTAAVVISPGEARGARRWFPRARIEVVPYFLPQDQAPLRFDPDAEGSHIYIPGVLSEARNAEGAAAVLEALRSTCPRPPVLLSSDTGYHDVLRPFLDADWVNVLPGETPLAQCFDLARVVLVPALRVTGAKTTVVEAWAANRPVVCTTAVAAGFPDAGEALAVAELPVDLARLTAAVFYDDPAKNRLVAAGRVASGRRARATVLAQMHRILDEVTAPGSGR